MTEDNLDFKAMCARFDVTPRTLRHYEYIELLRPDRVGRARFYGPREVARMTLILRGRRFGFKLEELRQWLELYDADMPSGTPAGSTPTYPAAATLARVPCTSVAIASRTL